MPRNQRSNSAAKNIADSSAPFASTPFENKAPQIENLLGEEAASNIDQEAPPFCKLPEHYFRNRLTLAGDSAQSFGNGPTLIVERWTGRRTPPED